jgi:hypothetical protein
MPDRDPKENIFESAARRAQDPTVSQADRAAALRIVLSEGSKMIASEEERKRLATRRAQMGLGAKMMDLFAGTLAGRRDAKTGELLPMSPGGFSERIGEGQLRITPRAFFDPRDTALLDDLAQFPGLRGLDPLFDPEAPGQRSPRSVTRKGGTEGQKGTPTQRVLER